MAPFIPPARLRLECESMRATHATLVELPDGRLVWCDIIRSNTGVEYHVVITYPPNFPYERPHAIIVAPEIDPGAPHRYLDAYQTLCLFPSLDDPTLGCTAGVVRARTALWIFFFEEWRRSGVWKGDELAH